MAKKENKAKEQHVEVDGKKYYVKDYSEEQKQLWNHWNDLIKKENAMAFNLIQVRGGKEYFGGLLANSLKNGKPESD